MHRLDSCLAITLCLTATAVRAQQDTATAVREAITNAIAYLERTQHEDGPWIYKQSPFVRRPGGAWHGSSFDGGLTALALYAMASSGVPVDKPSIRSALDWCSKNPEPFATGSRSTYSASLLVLALCRIDAAKHKKWIHELAKRIADSQLKNGLWSYELKSGTTAGKRRGRSPWGWIHNGDGSNTQFAVLALWSAQEVAKFRVPSRVWKKVRDYHEKAQYANGGWSYKEPRKSKEKTWPKRPGFGPGTSAPAWMYKPSPAMTAAGIFAHTCATASLAGGTRGLAKARKTKVVGKGLEAFRIDRARWDSLLNDYYFAYSVERVGSLHALPEREWYAAVAKKLIDRQASDGRWRRNAGKPGFGYGDRGQVYETSLALLCLSRASRHPITPRKSK